MQIRKPVVHIVMFDKGTPKDVELPTLCGRTKRRRANNPRGRFFLMCTACSNKSMADAKEGNGLINDMGTRLDAILNIANANNSVATNLDTGTIEVGVGNGTGSLS